MNTLKNVVPLFVILFICTLDGYSMMNYRLTEKRAYGCFAAVAFFCLAVNSYIIVYYGELVLRNSIFFTIGIPYFILILAITKDKISQTVFNFWLWINIYDIISNFSAFINDYTVKNYYYLTVLRFLLFCGYFVLYNKCLRKKHRDIMEKLKVNWWIFSFIPMFFTVLICLVNYYFADFHGLTRNYPVLLTIHILMLLVYILIFYTLKTSYDSMEREKLAQSMKSQIAMQKKQYEFYLRKEEEERIFRHDARHRNTILLSYLENGDIAGAKSFLNKELSEIKTNSHTAFSENALVNAVLTEYSTKACEKNINFSAEVSMPEKLACDEIELCVLLSNLLENSFEAAKTYIDVSMKPFNRQLSLNIKNDYDGQLMKNGDGSYATTKRQGSGLGIKSVGAIVKKNHGFLTIDDSDGVFNVFVTLKN